MDPITPVIDVFSVAVLVFIVFVGFRALRAFRQSKQAVAESASLLSVIVNSLTSRLQASESLVSDLRGSFDGINQRSAELVHEQSNLRASCLQALQYVQEILWNDKRIILELEELKLRLTSIQRKQTETGKMVRHGDGTALGMPSGNVLAALTPTERHTLDILWREGPKAAPELGRRSRKSREHMARLMKKLYLQGYVDRESNRAPFRYKLNEKVGSLLEVGEKSVTVKAAEEI